MTLQELLSDESKWTRHAEAKNELGLAVAPTANDAICWCLSGAITKCYGEYHHKEYIKVIKAIQKLYDPFAVGMVYFNDNLATFPDIRKVIEEAGV